MVDFSKFKEKKSTINKIFRHDFLTEFNAYNVDSPSGRVYVTPDGTFPSVTSFLSAVTDKEFLVKWKEKIGEEAAVIETARCADRGSGIHDALEHLMRNKPKPELAGKYLQMYYQLATELQINVDDVLALELPIWSNSMQLAGRVDCVAKYKNELAIIDYKTSSKFKRLSYITNYFLQATAYSVMIQEIYNISIQKLVIMICLESDVTPQIYVRQRSDFLPLLAAKIKEFRLIQQNKIIQSVSLFDSW